MEFETESQRQKKKVTSFVFLRVFVEMCSI